MLAKARSSSNLTQATVPKRLNSALEPIDLSSSPFPGNNTSKMTLARENVNIFATSSPPRKVAASRSIGAVAADSERNPFASSSPCHVAPIAKQAAEWDPISSSAPSG